MKKVILILVDGMTPDGFMQCGNPYNEVLLEKSSHALKGRTVWPSDTLPCHMSLFTSVPPVQHQTTSNTYCPPVNKVKGLVEQLEATGKRCAMFYNWGELRDIAAPGTFNFSLFIRDEADRVITDYAIEYIKKNSPDFTFLYLGNVDIVGHHHQWMSEKYLESVNGAVECIRLVMEALGDKYTYIITADHGGHEYDHGSECDDDMYIPILFIGKDFENNKEIEANIMDIAPTVCDIMDVKKQDCWKGSSKAPAKNAR